MSVASMTISLKDNEIQRFAKQEAWRESFEIVDGLKVKQVDRGRLTFQISLASPETMFGRTNQVKCDLLRLLSLLPAECTACRSHYP
jgi:hypothetical protein